MVLVNIEANTSPAVTTVVERKDRLGRMNVELAWAALSAAGRRLVVLDEPG